MRPRIHLCVLRGSSHVYGTLRLGSRASEVCIPRLSMQLYCLRVAYDWYVCSLPNLSGRFSFPAKQHAEGQEKVLLCDISRYAIKASPKNSRNLAPAPLARRNMIIFMVLIVSVTHLSQDGMERTYGESSST